MREPGSDTGSPLADQAPGLPDHVWITLAVILVVTVAVLFVGNVTQPVTRWEQVGPLVRPTAEVIERPGPEQCDQQDRTHLWISKVETYVRGVDGGFGLSDPVPFSADAALPDGATYTGWYDGERELWIDTSAYPMWFMPKGTHPNAVYIVSPSGVERWPQLTVFCW